MTEPLHMKNAIGIDIGGSKIALAVVDEKGQILAQSRIPTDPAAGFSSAVERISKEIEKLIKKMDQNSLAGIGVGCAGPVNPRQGTIENPYTLPGWQGCNIVSALSTRFHLPVVLENDADAAAIGECLAGAGRGCDPVLLLTFGTGVGGALIAGGQIYRGACGEHPEIGHIPVLKGGPVCYCGSKGCLESLASGTAITQFGRDSGFANAQDVFTAAEKGNGSARQIVGQAVEAVVTATWTFLHAFLPEKIIFGGGIMESHFERFASGVHEVLKNAPLVPKNRMISMAQAQLGNDAGMIGAAGLILKHNIQVL